MENSTLFASTVIAVAVGVLVGALPFILLRVRSGSAANNESRDIGALVERTGALERGQDAAGTIGCQLGRHRSADRNTGGIGQRDSRSIS